MFGRRKPTLAMPIPLLESPLPEVKERTKLISRGQIFEANDPGNKLGRRQTIIIDASRVVTQTGVVLEGARVSKLLGPVGTEYEQDNDPFMRDGALFVNRSGFPLTGLGLAFKQSPDLVGSYHLPLPLHSVIEQRKYGSTYVEPDLTEAAKASLIFDEIYFSHISPDERVAGLSPSDTVLVRSAVSEMFVQVPGL